MQNYNKRKNMNYKTLLIMSCIVLLGAGCGAESKKGKSMSTVVVGSMAPDFTLPDQNGKNHTLSSYRGHKMAENNLKTQAS
jgi:cytochrome oxidase Cu insertion factor (SCO1/SenC/PrrC family)